MPTRKAPPGYAPPLPAGCIQRRYREGDEHGILNLLMAAFEGHWPRRAISVPAIEHLRWKLHNDPLALRLHLVAELNGQLVAARPMWVDRAKVGDRVLLTRLAMDRAVAPEFQRMRVMTAMEARTPEEWFSLFDVTLGLSNNWQSITFVPGTRYQRKIRVMGRSLAGDFSLESPHSWTVQRREEFDDRVGELWDEAATEFRFAMVRSRQRLNYRFADARSGDYRIVTAEDGARLLGYAVYTLWEDVGQIADMLVLPGHMHVLEALLTASLNDLRGMGATRAECWRDLHHPYGPVIEQLGLVDKLRTQLFSLHATTAPASDIAFFANQRAPVHLMAGDTDLV